MCWTHHSVTSKRDLPTLKSFLAVSRFQFTELWCQVCESLTTMKMSTNYVDNFRWVHVFRRHVYVWRSENLSGPCLHPILNVVCLSFRNVCLWTVVRQKASDVLSITHTMEIAKWHWTMCRICCSQWTWFGFWMFCGRLQKKFFTSVCRHFSLEWKVWKRTWKHSSSTIWPLTTSCRLCRLWNRSSWNDWGSKWKYWSQSNTNVK